MGKMTIRVHFTLNFENCKKGRADLTNSCLRPQARHVASPLFPPSENGFGSVKAIAALIYHCFVNQPLDSTQKQLILFLSDFQCQNSTPSLFGFNKFILLFRTLCKMEKNKSRLV